MAEVMTMKAESGTSIEIKGTWYKVGFSVEVKVSPGEDTNVVKEKLWNSVNSEIEKQIKSIIEG